MTKKTLVILTLIASAVAGVIGTETLTSSPQQSAAGIILAYVIPFVVTSLLFWTMSLVIHWVVLRKFK